MKRYEYKVISGYYVRKEAHRTIRNRSGYAIACYCIYESEEDMNNCKMIGSCLSMIDVKEQIKALRVA